jgi:hypothetical protein
MGVAVAVAAVVECSEAVFMIRMVILLEVFI